MFVGAVAFGTLIPCTYTSFLGIGFGMSGRSPALGSSFWGASHGRSATWHVTFALVSQFVTPLIAGGFAGIVAIRLPLAIDDLARSARAIDLQQVALGRWAQQHLPEDARIGVNDTGADAYLSSQPERLTPA